MIKTHVKWCFRCVAEISKHFSWQNGRFHDSWFTFTRSVTLVGSDEVLIRQILPLPPTGETFFNNFPVLTSRKAQKPVNLRGWKEEALVLCPLTKFSSIFTGIWLWLVTVAWWRVFLTSQTPISLLWSRELLVAQICPRLQTDKDLERKKAQFPFQPLSDLQSQPVVSQIELHVDTESLN